MKITVYPTKKTSLLLVHPVDGPLLATGSDWTNDGFTARMSVQNLITQNESARYVGPAPVKRSKANKAKTQSKPKQPVARRSPSPYTARSKR